MDHLFKKIISITIMTFGMSMMISHATSTNTFDVVPTPQQVITHEGRFNLSGVNIRVDKKFDKDAGQYIKSFAKQLTASTGKASKISKNGQLQFVYDPSQSNESYEIDIMQHAVLVKAHDLNGIVYSIETIKQMLPVELYSGTLSATTDWSLQCGKIQDSPRFRYRGLMLDSSRHFISTDEIKKIIDVMVLHKLNRLHWHLTDDQGWRIEIKKYPRLTQIGSHRDGTCIGKDFNTNDHIPYGGFYTQKEIKEIVAYAASKGIVIIPEIDLPGHMVAALSSYPELGCTGGPYKVWHRWGISDDVLCPGKEETFTFLENVLSEICEIFPSEYIHIGGDECPKKSWEKCPLCQKRIEVLELKSDEKHTAEHYLQSYVTERVSNFLASKGRKIIGWDEILEGNTPEGSTVMSWRGSKGGIAAAAAGLDVIMAPNNYFYFDYYQTKAKENEPLAIGGYVPVKKVYSYELGMDPESEQHVLGIQANVWTEYISTNSYLEYMILPRIAALSEVQWCQKGTRNWERFKNSMDKIRRIYDELGYNYAKHMFTEE